MVYTDGACMKHSKQWRSRSEWIINQMRTKKKAEIAGNNIKLEQFVTSFMNLLCTCDEDGNKKPQLKEICDEIWSTVSDDNLRASVNAVKNYVLDRDVKQVLGNLLKLLYGQHALSEQSPEEGLRGAYRLTYILSEIIRNDFSLIQRYINELGQRQPKVHAFALEELSVDDLERFVRQGQPHGSLLAFNHEHSCEVTLRKVKKSGGSTAVSAKIKKVVADVADFVELERLVKELVTRTQTEPKEMEVDTNVGAEPQASNVPMDQGRLPQISTSTQRFVPQTESMEVSSSQAAPPAVQNQRPSESCLVHSLQWMATYQFVLNQCISRNILEEKDGHGFSQKVCTCSDGQENTDISQYFNSELDIQTKIRQVREEIKSWRNGIVVMQKFIWELEKEQQAGTWQSLLKFVHNFLELKATSRNGAPR